MRRKGVLHREKNAVFKGQLKHLHVVEVRLSRKAVPDSKKYPSCLLVFCAKTVVFAASCGQRGASRVPEQGQGRGRDSCSSSCLAKAWRKGKRQEQRDGMKRRKSLTPEMLGSQSSRTIPGFCWVTLARLRPRAAFCCYQVCRTACELFLQVKVPQFGKPWCSGL